MTKAIDFINYIKENKLEEIEFARGYDDNECLTFTVILSDEYEICYEFVHKRNEDNRIKLFHFLNNDDCDVECELITTKKALELRGLV